jgi:outer membrane protein assembly factor BamD
LKKIALALAIVAIASSAMSGCAHQPYLSSAKSGDDALTQCEKLEKSKDWDKANECLEVLKSRFSGTGAATEADLELGDNYYRKGDYLLASESYIAFTKLHPTHEKVGYAYYRIGLCYMKENPKAVDRDQKYLETSLEYFELAENNATGDLKVLAHEKWTEARTRIAQRQYYIGHFYHRTGEYMAAIPRFQDILTNYTGLGLDERALYMMGDSYVRLKDKERALEILGVFDQHFPDSKYRKKLASQLDVK